jgi:hypothetical protein
MVHVVAPHEDAAVVQKLQRNCQILNEMYVPCLLLLSFAVCIGWCGGWAVGTFLALKWWLSQTLSLGCGARVCTGRYIRYTVDLLVVRVLF